MGGRDGKFGIYQVHKIEGVRTDAEDRPREEIHIQTIKIE